MGSWEKISESESKKYCGSSVVEELGGLRWAAGRDLRLVVASPRAAQCKERENEGLKTKKSVHCYTVWETTQIKHFLPLFFIFFFSSVSFLCHDRVATVSFPCLSRVNIKKQFFWLGHLRDTQATMLFPFRCPTRVWHRHFAHFGVSVLHSFNDWEMAEVLSFFNLIHSKIPSHVGPDVMKWTLRQHGRF